MLTTAEVNGKLKILLTDCIIVTTLSTRIAWVYIAIAR